MKILGLSLFIPFRIIKISDGFEVLLFNPLTSPIASERVKGILVKFILCGWLTSPMTYIF